MSIPRIFRPLVPSGRFAVGCCLTLIVVCGCQLPVALNPLFIFAPPPRDVLSPLDPLPKPAQTATPLAIIGGGVPEGSLEVVGEVILEDRNVHMGIDVMLAREGRSTTLQTDPLGAYRFERVAAGEYTLSIAKDGYDSQAITLKLSSDGQSAPKLVLKSPPLAIQVAAASETLYVSPPDPRDVAVFPTRIKVTATIIRRNRDVIPGTADLIDWEISDPTRATVSADGVVSATAEPGDSSLEVTARSRSHRHVFASTTLQLRDPGTPLLIRLLSLTRGQL